MSALLRENIDALAYACPKNDYVSRCPFRTMAGLSYASRRSLLARLSHEQLVALFDVAHPCMCPMDPRSPTGAGEATPPAR